MSYYICGLDEVGRGALAGPILAVAAMFELPEKGDGTNWLKRNSPIPGVNDSKQIPTHAKRELMFKRILADATLVDFGIGHVSVEEINQEGIEMANRHAFYNAWNDLRRPPQYMLVDGDRPAPHWCYSQQENRPRGDGYWWPVGAASILAKVIRDRYMMELCEDFPGYNWRQNMGYGSAEHIEGLKKYGPTPLHRKQFVSKYVRNGT